MKRARARSWRLAAAALASVVVLGLGCDQIIGIETAQDDPALDDGGLDGGGGAGGSTTSGNAGGGDAGG